MTDYSLLAPAGHVPLHWQCLAGADGDVTICTASEGYW